jgi:two-component sensor histidine kinase
VPKNETSCDDLELKFTEHTAELKLLQQLNNMANLGRPLEDILNNITEGVSSIFNYAACDIYLLDPDANELVLASIFIDSKALKIVEALTGLSALGLRVPLFEGSEFTKVITSGEPSISTDMVKVFEDFTINKTLKKMASKVASIFGFKSALRAPLYAKNEVFGVMGVARKSNTTNEDTDVLLRFASQAALIIRKVQAEEALHKAYHELEEKIRQRTDDLRRTIDILDSEVTERIAAEERLKQLIEDKDMLMKEIHHRVKNNMAVIQSLLSLQLRDVSDEKSKSYFKDAQNRVKSMSMIHERLSRSEELFKMDLSEFIKSLTYYLFQSYGLDPSKVQLVVNIPEITIDVETMMPCGLIINELVSNAFKYAFPDDRAGVVTIGLLMGKDNEITLSVKDDGAGIPDDLNIYETKSLGLQIVSALTNQIQGDLELVKGNGTEIRITFKEKKFR